MAEDAHDELDDELDSYIERPVHPCKYARVIPDDLKIRIRKRVEINDDSSKSGHKWAGIARFLNAPGRDFDMPPEAIKQHFQRGHSDER